MNGESTTSGGLRGTRQLLYATLTLAGRRRRELSRLLVPALVLTLASLFLINRGTDMVFAGEFSDIWNRVNSDGLSFWTQEYREQLISIEMNLTSLGLPILIVGAIVYLLVTLVYLTSVSWICASDLIERPCSAVEALRWGIARLFRVSALCVKILGIGIAVVAALAAVIGLLLAITLVFNPAFVLLLIIAWSSVLMLAVAVMLIPGVLVVAFIAAEVGPKVSSLRYAVRLVRGSFWATLGRTYLIALAVLSMGICADVLISAIVPDSWYATHVISCATELAIVTVCAVGTCVLYHDLSGEVP